MGAYGSPELWPENNQNPNKKHKVGIVHSDLPVWKKVLLILYLIVLAFFSLMMFLTLETYMGNKIVGAIITAAFLTLGILFVTRISTHKKAWPFVLLSVVAFFTYFGAEPSSTVQTTNQTSKASSVQIQSSNVNQNSSEQSQASSAPPVDEVLKTDYRILYKDYEDNPIKADSKYRDKKLQLTGIIANIDRDIVQHPYITFNVDEYGAKSIKMSFSSDDEVINLKKGEKVTVTGVCGGTFASTIVVLDDCALVE